MGAVSVGLCGTMGHLHGRRISNGWHLATRTGDYQGHHHSMLFFLFGDFFLSVVNEIASRLLTRQSTPPVLLLKLTALLCSIHSHSLLASLAIWVQIFQIPGASLVPVICRQTGTSPGVSSRHFCPADPFITGDSRQARRLINGERVRVSQPRAR